MKDSKWKIKSIMEVKIPDELLEHIEFQDLLYNSALESIKIDPFTLAYELCQFIRYRPFHIDYAIEICINIDKDEDYIEDLQNHIAHLGLMKVPVFAYQLFEKGFLPLQTIKKYAQNIASMVVFQHQNLDNGFHIPTELLLDVSSHNDYLKFGFSKNTPCFYIKYDLINEITLCFDQSSSSINEQLDWSLYEWSKKPKSLFPISVAAHYGSLKAFRYFLLKGGLIDMNVCKEAIFGGSLEIFHMSLKANSGILTLIDFAAFSFRNHIFDWIFLNANSIKTRCIRSGNIRSVLFTLQNGISTNLGSKV